VLELDLGLRERDVIRVAAGPARKRLGIAREAGAHGGCERRKQTVVAFAEMHAVQNRLLGATGFRGFGEFQQQRVAANLEGRRVESLGLRFAPVPHGVQHAEARATQALAAADAPVVLRGWSKAFEARFDLRAALLLEPAEAAEALELAREDVAQCGQVPHVERGVIEQLRRERALGPVGLLAVLVERDAEMLIEERREADA